MIHEYFGNIEAFLGIVKNTFCKLSHFGGCPRIRRIRMGYQGQSELRDEPRIFGQWLPKNSEKDVEREVGDLFEQSQTSWWRNIIVLENSFRR